jgi:hypothetical protein
MAALPHRDSSVQVKLRHDYSLLPADDFASLALSLDSLRREDAGEKAVPQLCPNGVR